MYLRRHHVKRRYLQAWAGGFASIGIGAWGNMPPLNLPMEPAGWLAMSALASLFAAPVLLLLQRPKVDRLDLAFGLLMVVHAFRLVAFLNIFRVDHTSISLSRAVLYAAIMVAHIVVAREPEVYAIEGRNGA